MTDRLSTLLHQEASGVDVPSPPAADVLARGRRLRRERRTRTAFAGAVAAVLVAAGATVAADRLTDADDSVQPADQPAYEQRGAWAVGDRVHVGDHVVELPDAGWIGYSSAGALVATLDLATAGLDDRATITLVTPSGETRGLGAIGLPVSDPGSPVIVYSRRATEPGTWELVALDLTTDEERTIGTPWHARRASDLGRSGDLVVYVRGQRMATVDLRTGEQGRVTTLPEIGMTVMQSFGHGGYLTTAQPLGRPTRNWHLRSMSDGTLLASFPDGGAGQVRLSPDGRYVMTGDGESVTVYDVARQEPTPLELRGEPRDYGWTPDGHVVGPVNGDPTEGVAVCDAGSGSCTSVGGPSRADLELAAGAFNTGTPG